MNVEEFLKSFDTIAPAPVYLFCPFKAPNAKASTFEPILAQRAVDKVIARYVEPSMRDLGFAAYYADETDTSEIVSMASTLPFLTERRVVLVNHAHRLESEAAVKPMLAYLANPCETTLLLLVAHQIDRRSKFFKACQNAGAVVECPELKGAQIAAWIRDEMKARSKTIEPRALDLLMHRAGAHLSDVNNAVSLVCDYVGATVSAIREEDVRAACADVAEDEIWALTDAIAQSNTSEAICVLRELMGMGMKEVEIMGAINWLLKTAYALTTSGGSSKVNPYVAQKIGSLAEKIGPEKMPLTFRLSMDTELMLRSTGVIPALALELLVIKLAALARRPSKPAQGPRNKAR